ncbi:FOXJ1 protein, partial [Pitta sordida]|nr:FOXJ1 protein [Pitta sordida]
PRTPISAVTTTMHHAMAESPQLTENVNYKTNPHVRPPYSYTTLICMAMEASKKPKITLSAICKWISDNFCYFQRADHTWRTSVRNKLCTSKCFIKVTREKGEPGRGAFWKLHPQYADQFKNRTFGEQRTPLQIQPASTKRDQQKAISLATSACSSRNNIEVSTELQQLLNEFEVFESSQNWSPLENKARQQHKQPMPTAKASWPSSSASGTQEEQSELTEMKGGINWEALLNHLDEEDSFTPGDLELPPLIQPITLHPEWMGQGQHRHCPQGQEQILTKPNHNNPGLDETLMATAFLEHAWDEGRSDNLSNFI